MTSATKMIRAMKKLLTTTAFLLIALASVSSGQNMPDFEETKALAEQGDRSAQFNLGMKYLIGEGVPRNPVRGYVWFSVAAAQGYEPAGDMRDTIATKILTREELSRGRDIATRCFESNFQDCE